MIASDKDNKSENIFIVKHCGKLVSGKVVLKWAKKMKLLLVRV